MIFLIKFDPFRRRSHVKSLQIVRVVKRTNKKHLTNNPYSFSINGFLQLFLSYMLTGETQSNHKTVILPRPRLYSSFAQTHCSVVSNEFFYTYIWFAHLGNDDRPRELVNILKVYTLDAMHFTKGFQTPNWDRKSEKVPDWM